MKFLVSALSLLLVLQVAEPAPRAWPKILLIGDSITEMAVGPVNAPWSAMIGGRFHREADVVNRGAGGYTTRGYKLIFEEAVQELDPASVAVAVIFLGANDADQPPSAGYVPIPDYQNNLKDLISYLDKFGVSKDRVILLPPPPFYSRGATNTRTPEITEKYAEAATQVATANGITTVDIHSIFKKDPRGGNLFADGLHFNFDGAKLFYDSIVPAVEDKLKRYEGRDQLVHHFGPPT